MGFISQTSQIWLKNLKKDKSYQLNKSVPMGWGKKVSTDMPKKMV